ncbi:hypothetical protein GCM10009555_059250 [Acrocarpospora macrocephala]|uniref:CHRD domain-containing protein n=1 Tax=Acrocarpospora macrocephala TaxID=150177 RepID=A0A5M3WT81_9ACTN|nr:CHRD domain-containing protein [Acrocarpospora macrocephala]GES11850.1 hypothetical protein Amac_054470 [Acrocarpospora macrocephala]
MRTPLAAAAILATTAVLTLPAASAASAAESADHGYRAVELTGKQEIPGPGDRDGVGTFAWKVNGWRLCYILTSHKIGAPIAAHIHKGAKGVAGPIVVTLKTPVHGFATGCVTAVGKQNSDNAALRLTRAELKAIVKSPQLYYANVHNETFPAGAIRAQLATGSAKPAPDTTPTMEPPHHY